MKTNAQRLKELIKTAPIVKTNKIEFNCYQDNYKPVINIKGSEKIFDYSLFCETITNIATENKIYNVHFRGKDNIGKKKEKRQRQETQGQKLKQELKQLYPLLDVSVTSDRSSIDISVKNLHLTPYRLSEIKEYCETYKKIDRCPYTHEILSGGNTYVFINNRIDNDIKQQLDLMFVAYLHSLNHSDYKNITVWDLNNRYIDEMSYYDRQKYNDLLANEAYCNLDNIPPVIETIEAQPQQQTPETETPEETMNTENATAAPQDLNAQIDRLNLDLNKRIKLLEYLKQNGINGKIQEATEQEIKELKAEVAKLERPRLEARIAETKDFIANDTQKLLDATAQENIEDMAFYLNELMGFKQDLERDLQDLESLKEKEQEAQPEEPTEERTALVLTAPVTGDPQNVIPLFPVKKI